MSFDANMRFAINAAAKTRSLVPLSSNYEFVSSIILRENGMFLYRAMVKSLNAVRAVRPATKLDSNKNWLAWAKLVMTTASKHKTGNCGELGLIAAYELYQNGTRNVDYVMVEDGVTCNKVIPHAFAVIGRKKGSSKDDDNIGLPDSWGDDAVVCDPWDRVVYPGCEYTKFWGGLRGASKSPDKLTCTLLHRFT